MKRSILTLCATLGFIGLASGVTTNSEVTVFDTSFTGAEGYRAMDLAGQDGWMPLVASASNAFNVVDVATTGQANTLGRIAEFNRETGAGVFYDAAIRNLEDDAFEGSFDIQLELDPASGTVDQLGHKGVFSFGIAPGDTPSATNLSHNVYWDGTALFCVISFANGDIAVSFGAAWGVGAGNRLAFIDAATAGWDPASGSYTTKVLTVDWKLRKTRSLDVYQAFGSITVDGVEYKDPAVEYQLPKRTTVYNDEAAYFTMSHYLGAQIKNDAEELDDVINVRLHDIMLSHTADNLPIASAPQITQVISGDRSVQLEWDSVLDARYYDIYMTSGGKDYVVATNLSDVSYLDTPRWNDVENAYTLRAVFGNDVAPSYMEASTNATPSSKMTVFNMDGATQDWITDAGGTPIVSEAVADFVTLDRSGEVMDVPTSFSYLDRKTTPVVSPGYEDPDGTTYAGPKFYGVFQRDQGDGITKAADYVAHPDWYKDGYAFRWRENSSSYEFGLYGGNWEDSGKATALIFFQVEDFDWAANNQPVQSTVKLDEVGMQFYAKLIDFSSRGSLKAAVRLGADMWYVGGTEIVIANNAELRVTADAEVWYALGTDPTVPMVVGNDTIDITLLTNVTAVGLFADTFEAFNLSAFKVQMDGSVESYDWWTSHYQLAGEDAAATADPDNDEVSNEQEYAFGGNPTNQMDVGTLPVLDTTGFSHNGEEGYIYTYIESTDPGSPLLYELGTSENLIMDWSTNVHTVIGVDHFDYLWTAVTNFIPAARGGSTFIKLDL